MYACCYKMRKKVRDGTYYHTAVKIIPLISLFMNRTDMFYANWKVLNWNHKI